MFRLRVCGFNSFHVAAHTKIESHANPQQNCRAEGKNQEPPEHPHDGLGYQNEVSTADGILQG
jgi:hypothetical protein